MPTADTRAIRPWRCAATARLRRAGYKHYTSACGCL